MKNTLRHIIVTETINLNQIQSIFGPEVVEGPKGNYLIESNLETWQLRRVILAWVKGNHTIYGNELSWNEWQQIAAQGRKERKAA
jgi:hypothetical protein